MHGRLAWMALLVPIVGFGRPFPALSAGSEIEPSSVVFANLTGDLLFKAVDSDGKPIVGAVAVSADRIGRKQSKPTNETGWGVLPDWDGRSDVFVIAPHFGMEATHASFARDGRVTVSLKKANSLEIVVRTPDGTAVQDARLFFQTQGGPIFQGALSYPVEGWRQPYCISGGGGLRGGGCSNGKDQPETYSLFIHSNSDGRVRLEDVNRDLEITVLVTDELLTQLVEPEVIRVREGERAISTKTIPVPLSEVIVEVKDENGTPLKDAWVTVASVRRPVGPTSEYSDSSGRRTDEDGRCRFKVARSTLASLIVKLKGYESLYRGAVDVKPGELIPCVLKRREGQ